MTTALEGPPRSLFKNAVSQIGGRLLLSLGRLVIALLIVRLQGPEVFGAYALVLNFVFLFEWLTDFGQTDISVRNICRHPEREGAILGTLATLKAIHGIALLLLLPALLYAMQYPPHILRAGAVGGIGLLFYAGVLVFRTIFKIRMTMERDVAAELAGLAVMLPVTWYACEMQASLEVIVGCYVLSRVVSFVVAALLERPALSSIDRCVLQGSVRDLFGQALPLGIAGLLVSIYDSLAIVMLSKLVDFESVAQYAAATRYVFPVIIVVQALCSAFYAPLAAQWRASPVRFAQLQQNALDVSVMVAGGLFCAVHAGAVFLMGAMGPAIGSAAHVLQLMSWILLARAITTAMSPLIVIAGKQQKALWLTATSVVLQATVLLVLVPRFGIISAVIGYLAIELVLGVIPISLIGLRAAGISVNWIPTAKFIGSAALAVAIVGVFAGIGTATAAVLSGVLYVVLILISRAVPIRTLRAVLSEIKSKPNVGADHNQLG